MHLLTMLLFMYTLMISTLMICMSSAWFHLWVALEINMMMFMPLMYNNMNITLTAMIQYFFIQVVGSNLFLTSMAFSQLLPTNTFNLSMLTISMSLKLGIAPLHMWVSYISEGLKYYSLLIMLTWQKLGPMMILTTGKKEIILIMLVMSALLSSMSMFNQTSLRKLMAFSSINHMAWMMLFLYLDSKLWLYYLLMYTLMTLAVMLPLNKSKIDFALQMNNKNMLSSQMYITISMLSLGGMPPLLGFMPKWLMINSCPLEMLYVLAILIVTTMISLYSYMQLLHPMMLMQKKINFKQNNMHKLILSQLSMLFMCAPMFI